MSLRRIALTSVVAVAAMAGAAGATAAQASSGTICVALVVDGTPLGSNVSTSCATVRKGATGVDVLEAAGHTLGYRSSDGLICTIDGLPKAGCSAVDDSHFWAYFHRAPGATSWTYSTEGAGTYRPANAATEGWVYRDGTKATPANVPYRQICKTVPTKSPSPTPTRQPTHHPTAAPTPHHHRHVASPSASPRPSVTASLHRSHRPAPPHANRRPHRQHRQQAKPASAPAPTPTISPTSAALVGGTTSGTSGGSSTGLIVGVVAVVVLGGAAAYRFRRTSGRS